MASRIRTLATLLTREELGTMRLDAWVAETGPARDEAEAPMLLHAPRHSRPKLHVLSAPRNQA